MSGGKLIATQVIAGSYTPRAGLKAVIVTESSAGGASGPGGSYLGVLTSAKISGLARTIGEGGQGAPKA